MMLMGMNGFVLDVEQIPEKRPVVNHRLSQVFRCGFPLRVLRGDFARRAVVHHHVSVIHRDVGHALLEVANRVAARRHDLANEPIGLGHGTSRVVNEACLNGTPRGIEPRRIGWRQRTDVERVNTLRACLELGLGLSDRAFAANGSVVLRSETMSKLFAAATAEREPGNRRNQDDRNQHP